MRILSTMIISLLLAFVSCSSKPTLKSGEHYGTCAQPEVLSFSDPVDTSTVPMRADRFKIAVEVDFECSICIINILSAYNAYRKLREIHEIEFLIVTNHPHMAYVKLQAQRSLEGEKPAEEIYICQREILRYRDHTCLISPDSKLLAHCESNRKDLGEHLTQTFLEILSQ